MVHTFLQSLHQWLPLAYGGRHHKCHPYTRSQRTKIKKRDKEQGTMCQGGTVDHAWLWKTWKWVNFLFCVTHSTRVEWYLGDMSWDEGYSARILSDCSWVHWCHCVCSSGPTNWERGVLPFFFLALYCSSSLCFTCPHILYTPFFILSPLTTTLTSTLPSLVPLCGMHLNGNSCSFWRKWEKLYAKR